MSSGCRRRQKQRVHLSVALQEKPTCRKYRRHLRLISFAKSSADLGVKKSCRLDFTRIERSAVMCLLGTVASGNIESIVSILEMRMPFALEKFPFSPYSRIELGFVCVGVNVLHDFNIFFCQQLVVEEMLVDSIITAR